MNRNQGFIAVVTTVFLCLSLWQNMLLLKKVEDLYGKWVESQQKVQTLSIESGLLQSAYCSLANQQSKVKVYGNDNCLNYIRAVVDYYEKDTAAFEKLPTPTPAPTPCLIRDVDYCDKLRLRK